MCQNSKKCKICRVVFAVALVISVSLMIAGFIVPPQGVIDGSVLKASGILFGFAALASGMHAVELGYDLKLAKGDASIELNNN